jgi:transcriptional regulator with XRE-family HTH domain
MQNIGERLEEARKSKGISIREAAEATKVRGDYLHKFESNQFDLNLPDIYLRGFLRNYATYLGLSAEKIIADFRSLGHGNPKPKSSNREIYGRMDLTLGKAKETALEPTEESEDSEDGAKSNPATFKPLSGGLPYVDKALLIKGALVLAIAAVLVSLVIFAVKLFRGNSNDDADAINSASDAAAAVTVPQVVVHALDNVRIKMVDEATGAELFQGDLTRGDNRSFPKSSSMLLTADPIQNVEIEMNNQRYPTGLTGRDRIRIQ